jgi:hypothetical protein
VASKWLFVLGFPNGSPEIAKVGSLQLCETIISCADLWSGWGLNRSYSPHRELFNGISHATCTQRNWVDSQLSVVGSQTASLTPDLSFGHKLCHICPNGSCEPILDIYASISFQWYKEFLKARGFDLFNLSLKFSESTETSTPNMGVHLGVWVFILALSHSWAPLLARTLVNPCLNHEPKARVAIVGCVVWFVDCLLIARWTT